MLYKQTMEAEKAEVSRPPQEYELAYLLTPLLAAESLAGTVEDVFRRPLLDVQAEISEGAEPRLIDLAYPLRKRIEHQSAVFKQAFFGWLRFRLAPENVVALERQWFGRSSILRFLLVVAPPALLAGRRPAPVNQSPAAARRGERRAERVRGEGATLPAPALEAAGAMDRAAIDREIDHLLTPTNI